MNSYPRSTPWAHPDQVREVAPGIVEFATPSHGGYWLSPARLAALPPELGAFSPWAGPGWYEEDCDWAIVTAAFPELCPDKAVFHAVCTIRDYGADRADGTRYFGAAHAWLLSEAGAALRAIHDRFQATLTPSLTSHEPQTH